MWVITPMWEEQQGLGQKVHENNNTNVKQQHQHEK
jgi:hypothetical protein